MSRDSFLRRLPAHPQAEGMLSGVPLSVTRSSQSCVVQTSHSPHTRGLLYEHTPANL